MTSTSSLNGEPVRKRPVYASQGVAACNHPIASSVAINMLAGGGSAADAAVAAAFTLSVVEPMMIGPLGAGYIIHRDADGECLMIDNYTTAPARATEEMYELEPERGPLAVKGGKNEVGHLAAGVPGNLKGWWHLHQTKGKLPIGQVMAPAIWYAENGFPVSTYGVQSINSSKADLGLYPESARIFLRNGEPPAIGELITNKDAAQSLRLIERSGPTALYGGPIGDALVRDMEANDGLISQADLDGYDIRLREPIVGSYRGLEVIGAPPSSAGGLLNQLGLNILENFDVASLGFGTAKYWHLLIEVLKIMYAERAKFLGDPKFVDIPQEGLLDKDYARRRSKEIDPGKATAFAAGSPAGWRESANTTHLTVVTADGSTVTMTQTLNNIFGCKVTVPGTGLMLNNTMSLFDPRPGSPNSPGSKKRMLTATGASIVQKDGRPLFALGTPGGLRIFPTVLQGIVNAIDHGMNLQDSVDAARVWCSGADVEVEPGVPDEVRAQLEAMGHKVTLSPRIAGGMNGVQVDAQTGLLLGAACWRADGSPVGLSGGQATLGEGAPYPA